MGAMRLSGRWIAAAAAVVSMVAALVYLLQPTPTPAPPTPVAEVAAPAALPASAPVVVAAPVLAPATLPVAPASSAAVSTPFDLRAALVELFGQRAVLTLLQTDDFAHRLVATVDNLGREQASARLWPVNPMTGRFLVAQRNGVEAIATDNGLRYTAFVLLVENADLRQVVQVYQRMAPQFEQAYADLGFPGHPFQTRLLEVIDLLLATPVPTGPVAVHLPSTEGPIPVPRPWVLYSFDDPQLSSLSAGQKILVRMGPVNQRRLRAKLVELRSLLAPGAPAR
jgi:hypothetical protein